MDMQRTFCFCYSIRAGASFIGWFNFIVNSIYVGLVVFGLSRIETQIVTKKEAFLYRHKELQPNTSKSYNFTDSFDALPLEHTFDCDLKQIWGSNPVPQNSGDTASCVCDDLMEMIVNASIECFAVTTDHKKCYCELDYVSRVPIPSLYWSLLIPGVIIMVSVLWLSVVESDVYYYIRCIGFFFCVLLPLQLSLELSFLIFFQLATDRVSLFPIHPLVWATYAVYALLNVYFVPVVWSFIKLRSEEFHSGLEQGILTTERFPLTMSRLEKLVEGAFDDVTRERELDEEKLLI